mmetsp:Transcript_50489/g.132776  ORF Transcript_50489/g.132776 Transcript_50489/m.132776 type:complete len:354 (-) Transcript_50489:369-1430(-)
MLEGHALPLVYVLLSILRIGSGIVGSGSAVGCKRRESPTVYAELLDGISQPLMHLLCEVLCVLRQGEVCQLLPEEGVVNQRVELLFCGPVAPFSKELLCISDGLGVTTHLPQLLYCVLHRGYHLDLLTGALLHEHQEGIQDATEGYWHVHQQCDMQAPAPLSLHQACEVNYWFRVQEVQRIEAPAEVHDDTEAMRPRLVRVECRPPKVLHLWHDVRQTLLHCAWLRSKHCRTRTIPTNDAGGRAEIDRLGAGEHALSPCPRDKSIVQVLWSDWVDVVRQRDGGEETSVEFSQLLPLTPPVHLLRAIRYRPHVCGDVILNMPTSAAHRPQRWSGQLEVQTVAIWEETNLRPWPR